MSRFVRTAILTSMVSATCFGMIQPANAQFRGFSPNFVAGRTQAFVRPANTVGAGFNFNPWGSIGGLQRRYGAFERGYMGSLYGGMSPYLLAASMGGYGGGGGSIASPYSSSYGSWITAAPTNDSQDYIALNQASMSNRMMAEDLKAKKLQTRRAMFDEMRYERENTPTDEEIREEMRLQRLMRARNSPPENELVTAAPLNELLNSVQRTQARENVIGYAIPLDPEILKHINVMTLDNRSSNEFFKPGSLPDWPLAFDNEVFAADKKRFSEALFTMGKSQLDGKLNLAKTGDARKALATIRENLFLLRFNISSSDYIDALGYLTKLGDTVEVLSKPEAKKFMDGTYSAKGETVGDLLAYMTGKGLKFARATPGSEPSYAALYQALVTYELSLNRLVGKK